MSINNSDSSLGPNPENYFSLLPERADYRPVGQVTLDEGVKLVTGAILRAREHKKPKLLIDTSNLTGFPSPSITARYFFMKEWAAAAGGELSIAMVTRPEWIDPRKFGVTVGINSGLMNDVFASEAEALAWLKDV